MLSDIRETYRCSLGFALAAPLVFLIPALPELFQHAVEFRLGMYDSLAAFRAAAASDARLASGFVKVLALLLPGYWLVRYMASGDARRAIRPDAQAVRLWLPVFGPTAAIQALDLFAPPLHSMLHLSGARAGVIVDGGARLALTVLSVYLTAWAVAAPLGNATIGPIRSLAVMAGSFWRTIGYLVAGALPLMVVHYALGLGGIGRPAPVTIALLALDGLTVAMLAHTMTAAMVVAARAALARRGGTLVAAPLFPLVVAAA